MNKRSWGPGRRVAVAAIVGRRGRLRRRRAGGLPGPRSRLRPRRGDRSHRRGIGRARGGAHRQRPRGAGPCLRAREPRQRRSVRPGRARGLRQPAARGRQPPRGRATALPWRRASSTVAAASCRRPARSRAPMASLEVSLEDGTLSLEAVAATQRELRALVGQLPGGDPDIDTGVISPARRRHGVALRRGEPAARPARASSIGACRSSPSWPAATAIAPTCSPSPTPPRCAAPGA